MTKKKIQTPEEFKRKVIEELESSCRKDSCHWDTWGLDDFKTSKDGRFAAYLIGRCYGTYYPVPRDSSYCGVKIKDLLEGKEKETGMQKFEGDAFYPESFICSILEVSDDGKVKYMTGDDLEHILEL